MKVLQRVVWNTAGWRRPTGSSGESGYPAANGFGHEEWNFQTDDTVDGDVLGYICWNPGKKTLRDAGGAFDIGFWALHPETRRRLLVGRYQEASLADDEFLELVLDEFDDRGVFDRRAEELRSAVPSFSVQAAQAEVRRGMQQGWMRFRCPAEQIVTLEPSAYIELPQHIQDAGLSLRFAGPTFVDEFPSFETVANDNYGKASPLAEDAYYREIGAQLRQIIPLHNALSNAFAAWLKNKGYRDIQQETNRVDVEFKSKEGLHRAELKTCHGVGTTKAIREALGQLLEYNHFGNRTAAAVWWIVLDRAPTATDKAWVQVLRDERGLPLVLAWRVGTEFAIGNQPKKS
jgi:hypothetical protein